MKKEIYDMLSSKNTGGSKKVGVGVILHDTVANKILVGKRTDTKDWGTMGGKVEAGETIINAAVRECFEESGYAPKSLEFMGFFPHKGRGNETWTSFQFYCKQYQGKCTPELAEFESSMCWMPIHEALCLDLFEPCAKTLEVALDLGLIDIMELPKAWNDYIANGTGNGGLSVESYVTEGEVPVFEAAAIPSRSELYSHGRAPRSYPPSFSEGCSSPVSPLWD